MSDQGGSSADPTATQDGVVCQLFPALCVSPTPSGSTISTSGIDSSTVLPPPDVNSTSQSSTSISSSSTISTPSAIPTPSPSGSTQRSTTSPASTQSAQLTSPPVNIDSRASSSQPESITTTFLSTSGVQVVTITSVVENPAAKLNHSNDGNDDSNSFMSNRAAVIGVFTAVGVTVLVLFLILVLYIFRRRQARKQLERDHAIAAAGARGFLDDEDELGNEKSWWHGSSGTSLPGTQPVYYNPGPLDYSQPFVGAVHPYASAVPTSNRMAPPVDAYSNHQASVQALPSFTSPSTDLGNPANTQLPPSTAEVDISSSSFDHASHPPGQSASPSPGRTQESSSGGAHPYASPRRHTVYELLAEDVLAQQSPHHGPPVQHSSSTEMPGIEMVARGHSPGHLTTATPVMHNSPAVTDSDLFAGGSRSASADKEQWYDDDTDSESHAESGTSGLAPLPPSRQQGPLERAKPQAHDPRFSGLFGSSTAWAPTHLHQPRNSVDAGTICEEDQERFGRNGRVLTVANM